MTIQLRISANPLPTLACLKFSAAEQLQDLQKIWNFTRPNHVIYFGHIPDQVSSEAVLDSVLKAVEVIIIFGSNDLTVPKAGARLFHNIYPSNPNLKIIVTGKGGHCTVPGPILEPSEAEAFATVLRDAKIPANAIIIEPHSMNSGANVLLSHQALTQRGLSPRRFALVQTSAAHLRTLLTFERQWPGTWDYYVSVPPSLPEFSENDINSIQFHLIYALREIATLLLYMNDPTCPYITHRKVPEDIIQILAKYYAALSEQNLGASDTIRNISEINNLFRGIFSKMETAYLAE